MDSKPKNSDDSLLIAADTGNYLSVVELVSNGWDINFKNPTNLRSGENLSFNKGGAPLHYACRSGHVQIVSYLLSVGADVNILDIEDWTPLHYACYNGHTEIAKILLEKKPDLTIKDNYLHKTALEFAKYKQFGDIVVLLDPNSKDDWKRPVTDLEKAAKSRPITSKGLFLLRYKLSNESEKIIKQFRTDSKEADIEIVAVDAALGNTKVVIKFSHDFVSHERETLESVKKVSMKENSLFYRSSTISTNEHIIVYPYEEGKHANLVA